MAQPTAYNRASLYGVNYFTQFSTDTPTTPHQGVKLDGELNALETTVDGLCTNIALIQRDDGQLANVSVGVDQLKTELQAGINTPAIWLTATAYSLRDSVINSGSLYKCIVAHTSGTFATDLAAAKWSLLIDWNALVDNAPLSDASPARPKALATTSAGVAVTASRADHAHPLITIPMQFVRT